MIKKITYKISRLYSPGINCTSNFVNILPVKYLYERRTTNERDKSTGQGLQEKVFKVEQNCLWAEDKLRRLSKELKISQKNEKNQNKTSMAMAMGPSQIHGSVIGSPGP
jgi:hypothetical protein